MSSYLSPCPEWLHIDASVVQKNVKVQLLKNGNHQQPVKLGKSKVSVHLMLFFRAYVVLFVTAFLLKRLLAATDVTINFSSWWKQSVWPNRRTHRGQHCWGKSSNLYTWPLVHNATSLLWLRKPCRIFQVFIWWNNVPQVTREVPLMCTNITVLQTRGMAHLETAAKEGLSLSDSPCLRPVQSPTMSLCIQKARQQHRKCSVFRECDPQLESGRGCVDWYWPWQQLFRSCLAWISLQSGAPKEDLDFEGSHYIPKRLDPGCSWTLCCILQEGCKCLGDVWWPRKQSESSIREHKDLTPCCVLPKAVIALLQCTDFGDDPFYTHWFWWCSILHIKSLLQT